MTHRLSDIMAEMEKIERIERKQELRDDERLELAFIRVLRNAFTEFLEAKGWVKAVDTHYWEGQDSSTRHAGITFLVDTNHPDFGDVELKVTIEKGPN